MSKKKLGSEKLKKIKISACMIVKNEEAVISRCINSYKAVVDEIIVVDTGSVDKTREIAMGLNAKVYDFKWDDDFAAAKNFALDKATGDWVIFLDADEYFSDDLAKNIPNLIQKYGKENRKIILAKMLNIDEDDGEILCDFLQARIFKNEIGIRYVGRIHESLKSTREKIEAVLVEEKELKIIHTGYSKRITKEKAERNLNLLLKELEQGNTDPRLYSYIATSYSTLNQPKKAIEYSKKYLSSGAKMDGMDSKLYYLLIADMMAVDSDFDEVYGVIKEALEKFRDNPMPYAYLGQLYYAQKEYQNAIEAFEKAIDLQKKYRGFEMNFMVGKESHIYHILGSLYEIKGDVEKASKMYTLSLKENSKGEAALLAFLRLNRNATLNDLEAILFSLYDFNVEESVLFLNDIALKIKHKTVLKYCVDIMKEKFNHEDYSKVFLNVIDKEYLIAFKHFLEAYNLTNEEYYLYYAVIISQLSKMPAMLELIYEHTDGFLRKYIDYLTKRKEIISFDKNDLSGYQLYLNEMILITEDEELMRSVLNLSKYFDEDDELIKKLITDLLMKEKKYSLIITFLDNLDKSKNDYFELGKAYWYLKEYGLSVVNFDKALELGYKEKDLAEYLKWINEYEIDKKTVTEFENIEEIFLKTEEMNEYNILYEDELKSKISEEKITIDSVALYQAGEYKKAIDILQDGLKLYGNSYDILFNLGIINETLNNQNEAINYYRQARNTLNISEDYDKYIDVVERIKMMSVIEKTNENEFHKIESAHIKQPKAVDNIKVNRINFYNSLNTKVVFTATIVVWAYNRLEKTKNCVESILKWTNNVDYELILIDHGSTDGTLEYFENVEYNYKTVVKINQNVRGFGGRLIDSIIENRESKYLVIVPNDVYVTPNWLTNLLRCMESDPKIAWVMPASTNVSNLQEVNVKIDSLKDLYSFARNYNQSDPSKWEDRMRLVNVLTIYKRETFDMVGHVDAGFFHDFGEDDYSMRLRRNGYRLVFCGDTVVHHDHNFREMEDKNQEEYAKSLELGRQNFREKYYGIDAWDDILNFEEQMIAQLLENANIKNEIKVLGVDVRCGTPLLQIQNAFRKLGINHIDKSAYTTSAKYFQDLQTICDKNQVICDRIEYLNSHLKEHYDYVILGESVTHYEHYMEVISNIILTLNIGGRMIFKISNFVNDKNENNKILEEILEQSYNQKYKIVSNSRIVFDISNKDEQKIKQKLKDSNLNIEEEYLNTITREYLICIER